MTTATATFTVPAAAGTVYAVEQETDSGRTNYFLFTDDPVGRETARQLWLLAMREPWTAAVTRGPKPLDQIAAAFEAGAAVIDCR